MGKLDDLVLECTQMIAADGLESFSLRKLADRVGIKAPSIYEHCWRASNIPQVCAPSEYSGNVASLD